MSDATASLRQLLDELEASGIRLGLDAVRELLAVLGEPHLRLPHVLVAGTNGKGSTAAVLGSILVAAGYRTGLYTSPHLENVRERLRVDGRSITSLELARRLERVVEVANGTLGARPTYFEALTAVAFDWFAGEADIAVMEVGLGGRLDATNTGEPIAALVTEIGIDHVDHLGATEEAIALEKAGVMRPGRPALVAVSSAAARERLKTRAAEIGALWFDVNAEVEAAATTSGQIELKTPQATYRLDSGLVGAHQRRNIALAVRAAEVLALGGWSRISAATIFDGVRRCRWPGRLEAVDLAAGRQVLLDAAHNAQGATALGEYLAQTEGENCLLFGVLGDKDVGTVLPPLAARASRVILTAPDSPRAKRPETLIALVSGRPVAAYDDVGVALEAALASPEDRLVVCGSIYLVGDVRRRLRRRFGRPPAAVDLDLVAPEERGTGTNPLRG